MLSLVQKRMIVSRYIPYFVFKWLLYTHLFICCAQVMKEGSEGPITVNVQARELKIAEFDKKLFTALDQQLKNISVNDIVRILDGPLKVHMKLYRHALVVYLFIFFYVVFI